jgi:hypothetical protein
LDNEETTERKVPYRSKKAENVFFERTVDPMRDLVETMTGELIPPANTLRLPHGDAWASRRADASAYAGEYKTEQVHRPIGFDSTVAIDLGAFRDFVMGSVEELVGWQHGVLFEAVE